MPPIIMRQIDMQDLTKEQIRDLKRKYSWQKWDRKRRVDRNGDPIGWEFTFDTWLDTWVKSGHLEDRGTHIGQYVMARRDDIGPYSPDNVDIILASENISYRSTYWRMTDEQKKHLSEINTGKKLSDELKQKLSDIHKQRWSTVDRSKLNSGWSDERKANASKLRSGRKLEIVVCPHCNKTGGTGIMKRWHFDRCKFKGIDVA